MLISAIVRGNDMKSYLITIITVSICVGIYYVISPSFGGIEKYSKMIGMLIVFCVIISPIKELLNIFEETEFDDFRDSIINSENDTQGKYDEMFENYLSSFSIEEIKREIKNMLLEQFEIPNDECEISVFSEQKESALTLSKVQILLSGKSIFKNPYTIEEYFENRLNCICEVLIK